MVCKVDVERLKFTSAELLAWLGQPIGLFTAISFLVMHGNTTDYLLVHILYS
jgi:hypothetical protein